MLDSLTIITTSGFVLYQDTILRNNIELVNELITNYIIPQKDLETIQIKDQVFKYERNNDLELVFIAIYPARIDMNFVDDLLLSLKSEIARIYDKNELNLPEEETRKMISMIQQIVNKREKNRKPKDFTQSKKYLNTLKGSNQVPINEQKEDLLQIKKEFNKMPKPFEKKSKKLESTKTKGKQGRAWDASGAAITNSNNQLDFSNSAQNEEIVNADMIGSSFGNIKDGVYEALELQPSTPKSSFLANLITNFTVGKPLTEEMLKVPIQKIREHLIEKNVSAHVSESITESAKKNLVGTKLKTLESVNDLIRKQLSIHISKILTPQVSTDLIKEIKESNASRDIYSICFIGVNGVGKSTNLSKVCFWLLQNNLKILIAACDTFRSGAVEQLKVHVSNLSKLTTSSGLVDLFDRGYGKDPAGIAKEAIAYGKNNGYDVILIDTAGRMQDNEPLMRALTKLVTVNNPNKIIFVGEALVGNEGLDQITKFNQALKDFSGRDDFRLIDGMILTKFDTVDDKVGTALTMSYQTGKPIFFVGDGQTYTDLRKLNVENIVSTLLS